MRTILLSAALAAAAFPAVAADVINNDNKAPVAHDPTLVIEQMQIIQTLLNDLQKPNPPAELVQKLNTHFKTLQTEVRDVVDELGQCKAAKKSP